MSVPILTRWGLSPQADLVYRALADGPLSTAELAVQLGIGSRAAKSACEELAAGGAVRGELSQKGERLWRAVPTDRFLDSVRGRHLSTAHARAVVQQRVSTAAGHARIREVVRDAPGVSQLVGAAAVRGRIQQLVAAERFEHLAMSPEPVYDADALAAAAPLDLDLLSRGVRMRTLAHDSAATGLSATHVEELARRGAEQRVMPAVPAKMIIYDRRIALLPVDPADLSQGAVEVGVPAVVDTLVAMFFNAWEGATARGGPAAAPMTRREEAVVRLLLAGQTDAAIARSLGISARTVQYTIRSLMDRHGVNTRFALGYAIGHLRHDPPGSTPDPTTEGKSI